MHLSIALVYAQIVIRFTAPSAGSYELLSCNPCDPYTIRKEITNYVNRPCEVSLPIKKQDPHRVFWVTFHPAEPNDYNPIYEEPVPQENSEN